MDLPSAVGMNTTTSANQVGQLINFWPNRPWTYLGRPVLYALAFSDVTPLAALAFSAPVVQLATSFTMTVWVSPDAAHQIDVQSLTGTDGATGQRFIAAPCVAPTGQVCAAVSVGINGISVYQYSDALGVFSPLLVLPVDVLAWTLVVVVFSNNKPFVRYCLALSVLTH